MIGKEEHAYISPIIAQEFVSEDAWVSNSRVGGTMQPTDAKESDLMSLVRLENDDNNI